MTDKGIRGASGLSRMVNPHWSQRGPSAPQEMLTHAHRLIMESAEGPSNALLFGKAKRSELSESLRKLRHAIDLIERVINA